MSDDKKDKGATIIPFPQNRIVEKSTAGPASARVSKKIEEQQTRQFVETSVDDMSMNLLRQFYDLAIKTDKNTFTKDLALLVDMMRGLMYRDFGIKHPAQIDYTGVIDTQAQTKKPLSKEIKEDLKDLNETGIKFDPETDFE